MAAEVLNKRSDQVQASGIPTVPLASQMKYGELALNYANGAETMFIKNSNNDIVSFSNDNALLNYMSNTYYNKQQSGNAKIFYGTCATAAGTLVKTVTCPEFTSADLVIGAMIFVTFSNTNSGAVASLKLNVNSTGDMPMKKIYTNTLANLTNVGELRANQTYLFTYDGTNWVCMTLDYNSNSTYSAMTQAEVNAGSGTTGRTITPKMLRDNFYTETEVNNLLAAKANISDLAISSEYEMWTNDELFLEAGDTFEDAFSKLEKAILNNEEVISHALTDLNTSKQDVIDSSNKLSADLISDGTTNKVYTATEQTKLSGIAAGAEVNVQANWNETNSSSDAYIQNKPTIPQYDICTLSAYNQMATHDPDTYYIIIADNNE